MTKYAVRGADGGLVAVGIFEEAVREMLRTRPGATLTFSTKEDEEEFNATPRFEFKTDHGLSVFSIVTWPEHGGKERLLGYVITDADNRPRTMLNAQCVVISPRGDWAAMVDDYFDLEVERDG